MSVIRGTVLDAAGQPAASARVFFVSGPGSLPEVAALTDANGRFAVSAPRPGLYRLGCASDAAGAGEANVAVAAEGDLNVVVTLRR